ncbi:MAG: hypothetical protein L0332_02790 [Chloroflexi bacterium]|nr:hypothetical protein [Chloroflexota bacterium]MCI0645161.1 hypothetical protein [Chloroflexota bacterium]MCI0725641.1 hypothetical protein [Chloroflexota bacterium]
MTKIYRDIALAPDEQIGRIEDGKIYDTEIEPEEYIGWINYEEGEVFNEGDELMGWVEENGEVVASYEDEEEGIGIGYVTDEGELYVYAEEEDDDIYVGKVTDMKDAVEGAAALLFFFDEYEEDEGYIEE